MNQQTISDIVKASCDEERVADLQLGKMIAFSSCWILFSLIRKTVEKVTEKRNFSAKEISEAIKALHAKLAKANDMDSLQEIMKNLLEEL